MDAIKLLRWTVVSRETDAAGRLARGATGYRRTTEPQEEREEQFVRFSSRLRVMVSWGGVPIVATAEFSLTSGRCLGHPDWILRKEQLKPLRKLARLEFPKEDKSDDKKEEAEREAPSPPAETRVAVDAKPEAEVPREVAPDGTERQRSLFVE
jgi:hypothetical protein